MKLLNLTVHSGTASAEVKGDSGQTYIVVFVDDGDFYCSCMDYFIKGRRCKHVKFVLRAAQGKV